MVLKEALRRVHQPAALAGVDRRHAAAEGLRLAVTHFDEHHRRRTRPGGVLHHQVELTATVVRVGGEFGQSRALQQIACSDFDSLPTGASVNRHPRSARDGHR